MISRLNRFLCGSLFIMLVGVLGPMPSSKAQRSGPPGKIPAKVMDTLKARFPKAEIHKWTREQEGNTTLYDIEFTQGDRRFEADIREDGKIENWEMEIALSDLPEAVRRTVQGKYPKAVLELAMVVTAVRGTKEALEGYEIVFQSAAGKEEEITVAPDGRILEESGEKK